MCVGASPKHDRNVVCVTIILSAARQAQLHKHAENGKTQTARSQPLEGGVDCYAPYQNLQDAIAEGGCMYVSSMPTDPSTHTLEVCD